MATDLREAVVLHRLAYRDTSLILILLVRDHGMCRLVARGARQGRKPPVQAGSRLLVAWSGRGELKTLRRVELLQPAPRLSGERWYLFLYVNELLFRLSGYLADEVDILDSYLGIMEVLTVAPEVESHLRRFEFLLLRRLGYGIDFFRAANGRTAIQPEGLYVFQPDLGFLPASGERTDADRQVCFTGTRLLAIASSDFSSDEVALAAKQIARAALASLLGDRPLKARELFRTRS